MKITELRRETFSIDEDLQGLNKKLANDAYTELGYGLPLDRMQEHNISTQAATLLQELEIQPFRPDDVEKYMSRLSRTDLAKQLLPGTVAALAMALILFKMPSNPSSLEGTVAFLGILACVGGILLSVCRTGFSWHYTAIKEYHQPIPLFALDQAITIRRAATKHNMLASFGVAHFSKDRRVHHPDPFLYVTFFYQGTLSERIFIDVWDEPKFEQTRRA